MPYIYYRETGSGNPVVFLHGFCDSHELWTAFVEPFAKQYSVFTPDLPGFGKSEILPKPFSIDHVADAMAKWLQDLNLVPVVVVGHSLGGYIALALLERHPDLVAGIVLFHSTAYADSAERRQVRNKVIAFVEENGVTPFIDTFVPGLFADKKHPGIAAMYMRTKKTTQESLTGYAVAMRDRPDRSALLAVTSSPVLFIGGVKDTLIPLDDLRKQARLGRKTQLFELSDVAHMGMFEAAKQAQNILSNYLNEVWLIKGT